MAYLRSAISALKSRLNPYLVSGAKCGVQLTRMDSAIYPAELLFSNYFFT